MSDTPRTDKEIVGELLVFASFARKLERELAAVIEQRDRLAEALKPFTVLNPFSERVRELWNGFVSNAREALAAVEGGPQ